MNPSIDDLMVHELERVLREIRSQYEALHQLALEHRDAIRRADPVAIGECVEKQNLRVQRIADLEKRRLTVVGELAARLGCETKNQTPVGRLAQLLPPAAAERVTTIAQSLREVMEGVSRLNESTRRAAEALSAHMEGLMRVVAARLSHAQTYSSRGVVTAATRVVTALDSRA